MKPKILIVGKCPPDPGGVSVVTGTILDSAKIDREFELEVLRTSNNDPYEESDKTQIKLSYILRRLRLLFRLARFTIEDKPSIVHYHTTGDLSFVSDSLNLFLLKVLQQKVILHYHTDPSSSFVIFPPTNPRGLKAFIFRQTVKHTSLFLLLSKQHRDYVRSLPGIPKEKVQYLYNSVPKWLADKGQVKYKQDPKSKLNVLFLGRISKEKGFDDVVKLARRCSKASLDIEFLIAGTANSRAEEERIMRSDFINDLGNLELLGQISGEKKLELLRRADILLFPSLFEGFGVSIIEASAFSVPSLVYNIGSMKEIVLHRKTGFIVRAGSIDDLYNAILDVYFDRKLCRQLGHNARQRFFDLFNSEAFGNQLFSYYKCILMK